VPEGRITLAADALWRQVGHACAESRDPARLLRYGLGVKLEPIQGLTVEVARRYLRTLHLPLPPPQHDRRLWGCLVVSLGRPYVFYDSRASNEEIRYTLAHEAAHLWLHVMEPREKARKRLGPGVLEVLDGRREPSSSERLSAMVLGVSLAPTMDMLERDQALGLVDGGVLLAEQDADRLALELLAPEEEVLQTLPAPAPWSDWVAAAGRSLQGRYSLPQPIAEAYARRLGPRVGVDVSFAERLFGIGRYRTRWTADGSGREGR
jgi:hypothetical protein